MFFINNTYKQCSKCHCGNTKVKTVSVGSYCNTQKVGKSSKQILLSLWLSFLHEGWRVCLIVFSLIGLWRKHAALTRQNLILKAMSHEYADENTDKTAIAAFFKQPRVSGMEIQTFRTSFLQFSVLIFSSWALEVEKFCLQIELLDESVKCISELFRSSH